LLLAARPFVFFDAARQDVSRQAAKQARHLVEIGMPSSDAPPLHNYRYDAALCHLLPRHIHTSIDLIDICALKMCCDM